MCDKKESRLDPYIFRILKSEMQNFNISAYKSLSYIRLNASEDV